MRSSILTISALLSLAAAAMIDIHIAVTDSALTLTPVTAADCYWSGTAPVCQPDDNNDCPPPYRQCGTSRCGGGQCCMWGYKRRCCQGACDFSSEVAGVKSDTGHGAACVSESEISYCPAGAAEDNECRCLKMDKAFATSSKQHVLKGTFCNAGQQFQCDLERDVC